MLKRIDRVQVITANRRATAERYRLLLGAEVVGADRVPLLGAQRSVLRLGESDVELLEPDGTGAAADFLAATGGGLFAAGASVDDVDEARRRLRQNGVEASAAGDQLFVSDAGSAARLAALGLPGLRLVLSPEAKRSSAGLVRFLYEVTYLVEAFAPATQCAARVLGLDPVHFAPIRSPEFGYQGTLALFDAERLDRLEIIAPEDATKAMGRFFARRGPSLYMCYAEADDLRPIRERLEEHARRDWSGAPAPAALDNLFLHPKALGGMMMGVSRASFAWIWSGHPERVQPASSR